MRCTFCAGEHRQNECTAKDPMCINCGGQHRTLAAACKVRKDLIKKRSKEIRDRSHSRSRARTATHYATYSAAIQPGASEIRGPGTRQMDEPMMSKEESKLMMTTIMSAIIYAQYMEAVEPGSYQRNIEEIYKLNGLPPIKFPPPRMTGAVLQACREIFKEQTKEQEESSVRETESGDMDNISDEAIEREGMEIDRLIKRSRESLTPPLRDEKRKKDGSSSTQSKRPPTPPGKPQQPPHPPTQGAGRGAVPKEQQSREKEREREGEGRESFVPRARTSSTSSQSSQPDKNITREMGITVYVKKSSPLNTHSRDPRVREELRKAVIKGEAKFTWRNPKAERECIISGFSKGRLDMDEITYKRVEDTYFEKLISKCSGIYGN